MRRRSGGLFRERAGLYVDVDLSGNTLGKKIRRGQVEGYNFFFVSCVDSV